MDNSNSKPALVIENLSDIMRVLNNRNSELVELNKLYDQYKFLSRMRNDINQNLRIIHSICGQDIIKNTGFRLQVPSAYNTMSFSFLGVSVDSMKSIYQVLLTQCEEDIKTVVEELFTKILKIY